MTNEQKSKAAIQASGMTGAHAMDCAIDSDGVADIALEATYTAEMLEQLAAQMRAAETVFKTL